MQAFYFKKTAFAILCILFTAGKLYAQFEEGKPDLTQVTKIPCTAGNTYQPADVTVFQTLGESSKKIQNIISFRFDELAHTSSAAGAPLVYFKSGFTATATVSVEAWRTAPASNTAPDETIPLTLTVTYNPAAGAKYDPVAYRLLDNTMQGYEKVRVTLSPVQVSGLSNGWTAGDVLPLLRLENEMRVLRYFTNPLLPAPAFNTVSYDAANHPDQLPVSWAFPARANTSQLEYAWVENETKGYYSAGGTFNTDKLFRENSTRVDIDTSNQVFNIPLLFDANTAQGGGSLYYRVRSAYRKNDGSVITGDWSAPQTFSYNGHEPNLNWQSTTSFAENGKSKTVIQYFDGSLRPRQTVTKDNTTGNTTVAETIYDLQGRPSIQILPTPTINGAIAYAKDFNRFAGQSTNDDPAKYFDLAIAGNQCSGAPQLNTAYGNGAYYSPNNPWKNTESEAKFIPDANGYAFTQTRYTDDPTQRVSSQGGVGAAHQLGGTHTTDYYYGKPGQDELDALFGTEVGDASHYFKNMVKDANGQMSVSYVDMHGRTVATALAGDAPTALTGIYQNTAFYPATSNKITSYLVTPASNVVKGNAIENISTLLVPATTAYDFTYQLVPGILKQMDCNQQQICFDCKYDLEISIRQEGCNTMPIIRRYNNLRIVPADGACGTPMGFTGENITTPTTQISFSETLGIGSWVVRKTLSLNDSLFAIRHDSALQSFLCKTQQTITDSVFAAMQTTSSCAVPPAARNCTACQTLLGNSYATSSYKQNYIASSGGATTLTDVQIHALYTQDSLECAGACGLSQNPVFSTLNNIRNQMLDDMIPYMGQYAVSVDSLQTKYEGTYVNSLEAKYNIFTTAAGTYGTVAGGTKPYYKYPNGMYTDGSSAADRSIYPDGTSGSSILPSLPANDFAGMFNRNWADQLLYFHPEYPKLDYAQTNLSEVYAWQDRVMQCSTYAGAADSGYLNPTFKDPYFKISGSVPAADKTAMNGLINSTIDNDKPGFNIWRMANGSVLCDSTRPASEYSACLTGNTNDNDGMDDDIVTTAQKDAFWRSFKTIYLGYRNEMVTAYLNSQTSSSLSSANMTELLNRGKQLRFATNADVAKQNGWTWWSYATSNNPDSTTLANTTHSYVLANTTDKCVSQRIFWQSRLQQCEVLQNYLARETHNDSVTVSNIISLVLDSMVMVCHNSIDANNPAGASNVNPALLPQTPANFEDIINHVFTQNSIATLPGNNYFCNPYSVDYPKPYGSNPPVFEVKKGSVDSCNCAQFAAIKVSAKAGGYDTTSLGSMNQYLLANYGDTLSPMLWQGLQQCQNHSWVIKCPVIYSKTITIGSCTTCNGSWPYPESLIKSVFIKNPNSSNPNQDITYRYELNPHADSSFLQTSEFGTPYSLFRIYGDSVTLTDLSGCDDHWAYIISYYTYPPGQGTGIYILDGNRVTIDDSCTTGSCSNNSSNPIGLSSVISIPPFLSCGYVKPCITCSQLQAYTASFRQLYPAYSSVPYTSNVDTGQAKQNALWARYLNYRTGFNKTANEYITALQSCGTTPPPTIPANLVLTSRTTQPPAGTSQPQSYTAQSLITFDDGYVSASDDYFQTVFDSTGSNGGEGGNTTYALCAFDKPVTYVAIPDTAKAQQGSCAAVQQQADFIGLLLFSQRKDSLMANFDSLYRAKCLSAQQTEVFSVKYQPKEYHYTLYYYDQAGNLVKTIPPAAAKPNFDVAYLANVKTARANGNDQTNPLNNEAMATQYRYNTLNAVIAQTSPDGGTSSTWYDRLGRLAISQNAKQKASNNYSYTLYDALGRSTEVGQKPQTQFMTQTISGDTTALQNWLNGGGLKEQITRTVYDVQYANGTVITPYLTQLNLRNRVSYVEAVDMENTNGTYRTATFYSYDVHGNADTVLHDYGINSVMGVANNRFKLIKYDYDLISGKVNMVSYQPNKADGYYQQYRYDAENRLTNVLTSRDSILWQQDATYKYYRHGPLARMELGDLKVQGIDYAYTMQGWLKSINPSYNNVSGDLYDKDGTTTTPLFARDAYKLNLNYYDDGVYTDYKPIAPPTGYVQGNALPSSAKHNLYNGNISSIATNIRALNQPLLYNYQYDQLNRLVSMDAWKSDGLFAATEATAMQDYAERYTYDPNGNILSLSRNGTTANNHPLAMDNLSYKYLYQKAGNNGMGEYVPGQALPNDVDHLTNQLASVRDAVGDANYTNDIDNQNANNYTYDEAGNMTSDTKEGITNITWSVYGKILSVTKNGSNLTYTYDDMGDRISKKTGGITTWYVRDATGNTLATYVQGDNTKNSGTLTQTEVSLYGSNRIGVLNSTVNCSSLTQPLQTLFTRGNKQYELTNHLGNVLETISDKKLQFTTDNQTVAYYNPDVSSASDYYSFGMQMPERISAISRYRYGFNGKEMDGEIGEDNYDLGARIYDSRTGRMFSPDPREVNYPWQSTYSYIGNSPISKIDFNGEGDYYSKNGNKLGTDGKTVTQGTGKKAKQVSDDKAYVTTQGIIDANTENGVVNWDKVIANSGTSTLSVKNSVLQDLASSIYDESGGDKKESFVLGSTVMNGSKYLNTSITSYLKGQTSNYNGKSLYSKTGNGKYSMEAAINAVSGGVDYSNGAQFWDGKDVLLWSNHYRYQKAAYDSRQGIFVPENIMPSVMLLQLTMILEYTNKALSSPAGFKSDYWTSVKKVYRNQMTTRTATDIKGALWKVTAVHGHSIFYSEVPANTTSTEKTTPQSYVLPEGTESILDVLPKK